MHARYDTSVQAYSVSAFLIAQFGKNGAYEGLGAPETLNVKIIGGKLK